MDVSDVRRDGLAGRIVVLAGPGVIDEDALAPLRALAAAGALGVANTWGAKGVFSWDSPHHLGTCGLQARDFKLLGWADADAIVVTGLTDEVPPDRYAVAPVVEFPSRDLESLVGRVRASDTPVNDLYPRLAAVARPGYTDAKVPLHPARATADLGAALPPGGLVTAEPGVAGLWIARTFPTPALEPGAARRVVVPAQRAPGVAARLAVDAARAGRPAITVATAPLDAATTAALDAAADDELDLVSVVWGEEGSLPAADEHVTLLSAALAARGVTMLHVPVALEDTRLLVEAAGEVVAWGGIDG